MATARLTALTTAASWIGGLFKGKTGGAIAGITAAGATAVASNQITNGGLQDAAGGAIEAGVETTSFAGAQNLNIDSFGAGNASLQYIIGLLAGLADLLGFDEFGNKMRSFRADQQAKIQDMAKEAGDTNQMDGELLPVAGTVAATAVAGIAAPTLWSRLFGGAKPPTDIDGSGPKGGTPVDPKPIAVTAASDGTDIDRTPATNGDIDAPAETVKDRAVARASGVDTDGRKGKGLGRVGGWVGAGLTALSIIPTFAHASETTDTSVEAALVTAQITAEQVIPGVMAAELAMDGEYHLAAEIAAEDAGMLAGMWAGAAAGGAAGVWVAGWGAIPGAIIGGGAGAFLGQAGVDKALDWFGLSAEYNQSAEGKPVFAPTESSAEYRLRMENTGVQMGLGM